jgi:hypothetical protein
MPLDELEFSAAFRKLRDEMEKLDNAPLKEVLSKMLVLIESTYDRITEILDADDDE